MKKLIDSLFDSRDDDLVKRFRRILVILYGGDFLLSYFLRSNIHILVGCVGVFCLLDQKQKPYAEQSASGILERLRQNACMCQANERRQVSFNGRPDRSTAACPLFCRNVMLSGKGGGDFFLRACSGRDCDPGHTWPVGYSSGKKTYNGSSVNAASPGDRHSDLTAESASVTCRQKMPTFFLPGSGKYLWMLEQMLVESVKHDVFSTLPHLRLI
ncbi:hypothetical protein T07_9937 [Trichinella nelsoni]|uniref:Uncharacterized protein n=1 Tax=Trichinella nelsoni TaxID=6336 RepID=A0A0V0RJR3_9BILA|nr:hypothetical protein T07_9937 [Trichinella nelsoni]